jgi:hypothetical protein
MQLSAVKKAVAIGDAPEVTRQGLSGRREADLRAMLVWNWMITKPTHDLIGALVWWKHWIEDVLYSPTSDDQRYALHEPHPANFKCRQP